MDILLGIVRIIVIAFAIWIAVQFVKLQYYKWENSWYYDEKPFPWWYNDR